MKSERKLLNSKGRLHHMEYHPKVNWRCISFHVHHFAAPFIRSLLHCLGCGWEENFPKSEFYDVLSFFWIKNHTRSCLVSPSNILLVQE